MSNGIIYILANPAMIDPETKGPIVKIGITQDLATRLSTLYSSGVPLPFQCIFACEVENYNVVEKDLHNALKDYRVNVKREFFNIDPNLIIPLLKHFVGFREITLEVEEEIVKLDDSTEEITQIPPNYDTYENLKPLLDLSEGFLGGYFCIRVSRLHRVRQVDIFKLNGKTYYDKDIFLEQAKKENILKTNNR
jgi:hypothetical protein